MLAGRKNTGIIKGEVLVNGKPVDGRSFKHIMGYVEQFDSLSPQDTVREAIEFSAALRLPKGTTNNVRQSWVDRVVDLLELESIKNSTVGEREAGGLSFEQKKRISIGVELAANPSVLVST